MTHSHHKRPSDLEQTLAVAAELQATAIRASAQQAAAAVQISAQLYKLFNSIMNPYEWPKYKK